MTETNVQREAPDPVTAPIGQHDSLAQENAQLRRQLAGLHAELDQLVDERLAELATLQECDLQIFARLDKEHVLNAVLDWAMLVTSAVAGALYLIVEPKQPAQEQKTLRAVAQRGYWPEMDLDEPLPWPDNQDILARALETGQAVQQTHVCQDRLPPLQHDPDRSHLAVPILPAHQPAIGVFALESGFPGGFTDAQIDSATRLAGHAALAIQNALRYQQTHQRLEGSLAVHTSSLNLAPWREPKALPERIVCSALELLQADRAALYHYDSSLKAWALAAALNRADDQHNAVQLSERALAETAARDKTAQFAHDPTGSDVIALPLSAKDPSPHIAPEILGVLLLAFKPGSNPPQKERERIDLYADQAAIALKSAQKIAQLERAVQHQQERANHVTYETTPALTAIQGYVRLMLQSIGGAITGQQREFLETILKNATQLETLLGKQPRS